VVPRTVLESSDIFQAAEPEIRAAMLEAAGRAVLEPEQSFACEGDVMTCLAVLGSGRLRVYKLTPEGREITLYYVTGGEFCTLNLLGVLARSPSPAHAIAMTRVEAVTLPADRFRDWLQRSPGLREVVYRHLALQVGDLMTLVEEIVSARMDERLAGYLEEHAVAAADGVRSCAVTHEQIARELGTAREVVSRLLKLFEREGAVRLARGRVDLVAPERLPMS